MCDIIEKRISDSVASEMKAYQQQQDTTLTTIERELNAGLISNDEFAQKQRSAEMVYQQQHDTLKKEVYYKEENDSLFKVTSRIFDKILSELFGNIETGWIKLFYLLLQTQPKGMASEQSKHDFYDQNQKTADRILNSKENWNNVVEYSLLD